MEATPTSFDAEKTIPIRRIDPIRRRNLQRGRPSPTQEALSIWIPVLIGLVVGIASVFLIVRQEWVALIALLLLIPAVVLLLVYPFISVLVWLLLLPFFLQEFIPGSRYIFWILHRAMIPAALGATILLHLTGIRRIRPLRACKICRFGWVDLAMLAFIVLSVANILLLAEAPTTQLIRFYDRLLIPFGMFWLVRLLAPGERDLRWMIPVAFTIIIAQSIIGLISWFAPQMLPEVWLSRIGERTVGTFGNPAVYTSTLIFCILILVQMSQASPSFLQRMAALAAIGVALFLVFFSFSRGSWLGALAVCLGLTIMYPGTTFKVIFAGGLISLILLAATPLSDYLLFAEERLFTQTTAESRVIGGAASYRMIETYPVRGWGFGNHELYDEQFRSPVFGLASTDEQSSHNTYLLVAAEMGIPSLILYLAPAAWLLVNSIKYRRWLPKDGMMGRMMLFLLWLLLVDYFIVALFTDLIQSNFFSTVIWWLALAWIANIVDTARAAAETRQTGMLSAYGK